MATFSETLLPELQGLYNSNNAEISQLEISNPNDGISACDVLRAHFCIADHFLREGEGEGMGGFGPKDINMLLSALSRPHVSFGGISKWNTIHEKAATLLYGLIKNHPFYDANKRTAYLSTIHYMYSEGYMLSVSQKELEDLTVLIAEDNLKKFPRYRELLKHSADPEVEYIAWHLKNISHQTDKRQYLVTYRELEKILKKYDVFMENPNNSFIDIMRWEEVSIPPRGIFKKQKPKTTKEIRKVCSLGFPGWSKQVGKGRIRHLREALDLTPHNGVDAQSFFYGVDDMRVMIDLYEGALRRLAYR